MNPSVDFFRDRHVLVVGGSSGIGAGIGAAFAAHGAQVTVTGATDSEVDAARADGALGGVTVARLDVRDDAAVADSGRAPWTSSTCWSTAPASSGAAPSTIRRSSPRCSTSTSTARCASVPRRAPLLKAQRRLHRQHGVDAELLRRRPGARLQRQQGRRRAADQVAGDRLCGRRHPRQRGGAGLDRHAADRSRCRTTRRAAAPILARTPLGRWGTPEDVAGAGAVSGHRPRPVSSPASCCRSTAAT